MAQTFDSITQKLPPRKFAMLIGMMSSVMVFASLTSAYIVRKGQGGWLDFSLPSSFFISTALIICSSVLLHGSFLAFKDGKEKNYKTLLLVGTLLGFGFVIFQYLGWKELKANGVYLGVNSAGDFLYLLTGIHVAHVIAGISGLMVALFHAFTLPFEPTPRRKTRLDVTLMFWHFLGIVWLYLLMFILFI